MPRKFTTSYDELIKSYYGDPSWNGSKDAVSIEELFANYYGKGSVIHEEKKKRQPATALSLPHDDGEVLVQRPGRRSQYGCQESTPTPEFEEYVVTNDATAVESSVAMSVEADRADNLNIREEYTVDILSPLEDSPATNSRIVAEEYRSATPASPAVAAAATPNPYPREEPREEVSRAKVTDDDIIDDLQEILEGEKVYDPHSKSTVERSHLRGAQATSNAPPAAQATGDHAIFERIAQSMTYANAYDLGTVELENRFSDFDRMSELEQKAACDRQNKSQYAQPHSVARASQIDNADFIEDLDSIHREHHHSHDHPDAIAETMSAAIVEEMKQPRTDPVCRPWALSLSATDNPSDYSRPLYDAGEHVEMGWDLFTDQLRVGKPPGVLFSYGELIAMGDLYEDCTQMMEAGHDELLRVKDLLNRSKRYYSGHRANKSLDVSDDDWVSAVGMRYIELAEENYSHYAPNNVFHHEPWVANVGQRKHNKSEWEHYHAQAITEAQKILLNSPAGAAPPFLERPLIINGFGDHFLTDAFSAGHTISKDATIEQFRYNFYNGKSLKPTAEKFFKRLAQKAFKGDVAKKFSVLETFDPVFLWWNPNIDTVNAFRKLLIKIAEQRPDVVGNLAVKALHDELNKLGVEVTNDFASKPWRLTGDGLLDTANLEIIKKAVQQSVDNVNDPANRTSANIAAAFDRVWKHVPRLTDAGKMQVRIASERYTDPESDMLVEAAADLISRKVNIFIDKLLKEHKLKRA